MIELVIRKEGNEDKLAQFTDVIVEYMTTELDDKWVLDVPIDWSGFGDSGMMRDMLNVFGETIYVALAYFASEGETVTDIYGDYVDRYVASVDGKRADKYVKKNLKITRVMNKEENIFEVKSYVLDLRVVPPFIKILDVYSGSKESGIQVVDFLSGNR
jgi:hypothetical protein